MENLTIEINPKGKNTEERQADLIRQLRLQNAELKRIIEGIYLNIEEIKKENKK